MVIIKSDREILLMKEAGKIVAEVFERIGPMCVKNTTTMELANVAEEIIRSRGAIPTFKNHGGFPGAVCISVNDTLIHGIPSSKTILKEGDIVSIDVGATYKGYIADACRTFMVGKCSKEAVDLVNTTRESFFEAVKLIKPGVHLGDISNAIETYCKSRGYSLPVEFAGHGVGTKLHEDPSIPNLGTKGTGIILKKGMCLAIEPMVNVGSPSVKMLSDEWTVKTKDGKLSAHYENTIAVTETGYEILTMSENEKGVN